VSACEALSNTAISAAREEKHALCDRLTNASIQFADAISSGGELKPYDGRAVAKAYVTANRPEKALEAISKIPTDRIDHWVLYRKAEAELAGDAFDDALVTAQNALDLVAKDSKATAHVSSYHKLLSEVYERLGQIQDALLEAENAMNKCENIQFRIELAERVSNLKGMSA
jgi:tetratricopeptide (TPR) repeat protein